MSMEILLLGVERRFDVVEPGRDGDKVVTSRKGVGR
jgi:hypothetical protein